MSAARALTFGPNQLAIGSYNNNNNNNNKVNLYTAPKSKK